LVIAICGITAGSVFATTELRILLIDVVDSTYKIWPTIGLTLYVDDFTIDVTGTLRYVSRTLPRVTDHIIKFLQEVLNLEVSKTKSVVVGSTVNLSKAVVNNMTSKVVTAKRSAKMLGTSHGGGRRRSVQALYSRVANFSRKIKRIHALRRAGIRTPAIVRAAGTPAVTYGVEVVGMSDSHLHKARCAIAHAAAPEGGGKDPNLILYILDGVSGTTDPAFDAHVLPVLRFSYVFWENWQSSASLKIAFDTAQRKLKLAKRSVWDVTAGPVAAMIASLWRLKWVMASYHVFVNDEGRAFDLHVDPPVVLANAVKGSVRRWRLAQVLLKYPNMGTSKPDYIAPNMSEQFFYNDGLVPQGTVDLVGAIQRLTDKGGYKSKMFPIWESKFRASLISTFSGGQWTQSRLHSTRAWTDDSSCQLCKNSVGTLAHRRSCPTTMPTGGWPSPPKPAAAFIAQCSSKRMCLAYDRAIFTAVIIVPPPPVEECFQWWLPPPDSIPPDARWYIDGSLIHARPKNASRTGFGIAVVAADGTLLAYGNGNPPDWITDAAGAESWAFYVTVLACMSCPHVVTDCLNILIMLELGPDLATAANRSLARIWNLIFNVLDGGCHAALANSRVVWMPSHRTVASIGNVRKSNGKFITALDWRANRLVDKLAKLGAQQHCVPDLAVDKYNAAMAAAEYFAALVGTVTFKANHHLVQVTRRSGSQGFSTVRDSLPGPRPHRPYKRKAESEAVGSPLPPPPVSTTGCHQPGLSSSDVPKVATAQALYAARVKKARLQTELSAEQRFQSAWRENRDKRSASAPSRTTAKDRIDALRRRILGS
jgi:hypothetical protein